MEKFHRKLLALSLPRSGTRYLVRVLRNCGVKVGHECFKDDGTIGMFFAVEDVWYPGKHWATDDAHPIEDESLQRRSCFEFEQVWHYTRDPRKVIPSLASKFLAASIWCWQERHTGISAGLYPKTLRAMLFWVAWNEMIEKNEDIDYFFRIEDIDAQWPEICRRLDLGERDLPEVPRDWGRAEKGPNQIQPMSFEQMDEIDWAVALRVREMAARYGYNTEEPL